MTNSQKREGAALYSQLENEYGNVVYSQVTQEEARSRLAQSHKRLKTTQIILSAFSTAGIVSVLVSEETWAAVITALITFFLLSLNLYNLNFNVEEKTVRHQQAADQLWLLQRKYSSLLTDFDSLGIDEIRERRDTLFKESSELYSSVERTDDKSFKKAQKRLKVEGFKDFSREELNKILPEHLQK